MNRAFTEHVFAPAQGHRDQRTLARQPTLIIEPLAAITHTGHQHAVDPALEHCRHREPEDREIEDQQVGP
ncbi:hypothetical protein AZH11_19465 [Pseudomonas simiae]|nr:hypothetical protein AZH11_19465 [Pseudomonas simiae]